MGSAGFVLNLSLFSPESSKSRTTWHIKDGGNGDNWSLEEKIQLTFVFSYISCETSRLVKSRHPVSGADCELHIVVAPSDRRDFGRSILHLLDVLDVPGQSVRGHFLDNGGNSNLNCMMTALFCLLSFRLLNYGRYLAFCS